MDIKGTFMDKYGDLLEEICKELITKNFDIPQPPDDKKQEILNGLLTILADEISKKTQHKIKEFTCTTILFAREDFGVASTIATGVFKDEELFRKLYITKTGFRVSIYIFGKQK